MNTLSSTNSWKCLDMSLTNISDKIISKEFEILSARNLKLKLDKFRLKNELEFKFKKTIN